jgi:hypothetical protein
MVAYNRSSANNTRENKRAERTITAIIKPYHLFLFPLTAFPASWKVWSGGSSMGQFPCCCCCCFAYFPNLLPLFFFIHSIIWKAVLTQFGSQLSQLLKMTKRSK